MAMLRRKGFFVQTGRLFSLMLILVVFALAISGCGSGGGGTGNGGSGGGGTDNGGSGDFSAFIGVWKSVGVSPEVEITVSQPIEGSYLSTTDQAEVMFFTGRVTCNVFSEGYLNTTGSSILSDNIIWASIYEFAKSFHVRTREEVEGEFGQLVVNKLELDGHLANDNTLNVGYLYIVHKNEDIKVFDPDDDTYLTFNKQ